MRIGNFELYVWPNENETPEGLVEMQSGENYAVNMSNHSSQKADAELSIDGKIIGTFRVGPYQTIKIERPLDDLRKFTFYKSGSVGYRKAKYKKIPREDRGVVSVTFKPEVIKQRKSYGYRGPSGQRMCSGEPIAVNYMSTGNQFGQSLSNSDYHIQCKSSADRVEGITGLSGKSKQAFYTVPDLEYALNQFVTINLRLVGINNQEEVTELKCNRQHCLCNPIPDPV